MNLTATIGSALVASGIPSPSKAVWNLGPLPIRAYALFILAGIVAGAWIGARRYAARGGEAAVMADSLVWAVPFGIVGARLYHIFTSPDRYFGENGDLAAIFRIWEGGLGVWGAIAAGALGAYLYVRRKGLRFTMYADSLAPGILIAQGLGRIGNYMNQEVYGGATTAPWGLQIDHPPAGFAPGTLFHPTFLYELLWNFAMAGLIIVIDRKLRLGFGRVFWLYVAAYTAGRGWIEMLRIDDAQIIAGLRINVWTSLILFTVAVVMFIIIGRAYPGREASPYLPGKDPQPLEDEQMLATSAALNNGEGSTPEESGSAPTPSEPPGTS